MLPSFLRNVYSTEHFIEFMAMLSKLEQLPDPTVGVLQLRDVLAQAYNRGDILDEFDALFEIPRLPLLETLSDTISSVPSSGGA